MKGGDMCTFKFTKTAVPPLAVFSLVQKKAYGMWGTGPGLKKLT